MEEFTLRPATDDDAEALAALSLESSAYYAELAPGTHAPGVGAGFAEWIASSWQDEPTALPGSPKLPARLPAASRPKSRSRTTGAKFFGNRDLRERRLHINAVLTAERWRRHGIATSLVEAAERWGRERGAVVALLDTFYDSPLSVPFWEKRMGYARQSIVFRKQL